MNRTKRDARLTKQLGRARAETRAPAHRPAFARPTSGPSTVTVFFHYSEVSAGMAHRLDVLAAEGGAERVSEEIHAGEAGVAYRFPNVEAASRFKGSLPRGVTSL